MVELLLLLASDFSPLLTDSELEFSDVEPPN
jgi:hypothetical protein